MPDIQPGGFQSGYLTMANGMSVIGDRNARAAAFLQDQPYLQAQQAAQTQAQNLQSQYLPLTMQNATQGSPFQQRQSGIQQQQFGQTLGIQQQGMERQYAALQAQINQQMITNSMGHQKMIYEQYGPKMVPGVGFAYPPGSPLDPANQQGDSQQQGGMLPGGVPQGPAAATPGQPMPQGGAQGPQAMPMPGGGQAMPQGGAQGPQAMPMPGGGQAMPQQQPQQAQQPNPMPQQAGGGGSIYPIQGMVPPSAKPLMELAAQRDKMLTPIVTLDANLAHMQSMVNTGVSASSAQLHQVLANMFGPNRVSNPLLENNENFGSIAGRVNNMLARFGEGHYSEGNIQEIQDVINSVRREVTVPARQQIETYYQNFAKQALRTSPSQFPAAPDPYSKIISNLKTPASQSLSALTGTSKTIGNFQFPSAAAAQKYAADLAKYQASQSGRQ